MDYSTKHDGQLQLETTDAYEPPRVESVLTSEELEREVLYAGMVSDPCFPFGCE